jgi:hypothetical protein
VLGAVSHVSQQDVSGAGECAACVRCQLSHRWAREVGVCWVVGAGTACVCGLLVCVRCAPCVCMSWCRLGSPQRHTAQGVPMSQSAACARCHRHSYAQPSVSVLCCRACGAPPPPVGRPARLKQPAHAARHLLARGDIGRRIMDLLMACARTSSSIGHTTGHCVANVLPLGLWPLAQCAMLQSGGWFHCSAWLRLPTRVRFERVLGVCSFMVCVRVCAR